MGPQVEELLRRLQGMAEVDVSAEGTTLVLTAWEGRPLAPPARVDVDPGFEDFVLDEDDRVALWPDRSARSAALNLVLVHLHESILTDAHLVGPLSLSRHGLVVPSRDDADAPPLTDGYAVAPLSQEEFRSERNRRG